MSGRVQGRGSWLRVAGDGWWLRSIGARGWVALHLLEMDREIYLIAGKELGERAESEERQVGLLAPLREKKKKKKKKGRGRGVAQGKRGGIVCVFCGVSGEGCHAIAWLRR
ncbi:unnamed protein product, partial [Musa hybrid cultivar]